MSSRAGSSPDGRCGSASGHRGPLWTARGRCGRRHAVDRRERSRRRRAAHRSLPYRRRRSALRRWRSRGAPARSRAGRSRRRRGGAARRHRSSCARGAPRAPRGARPPAHDVAPGRQPRGEPVDVDTASAAAAEQVTRAFDEEWAGFGDGVKRPHTSAVAFALTYGVRTGDRALREIGVRTLDRLGWSALSDARTGAFHRLCRARDWSEPDTARLLGVQADLAGLLLDAAVILEEDAYAERARAAIDYVIGALGDPAGGFFESEAEAVDRICVTASNARMVRTLLRAADVLRTPRYGELALAGDRAPRPRGLRARRRARALPGVGRRDVPT